VVGFLDQDCQLSAVYERENSMRNCFLWLGVMTLVVSSFGCGGADTEDTNPVTGKITYDGEALAGARIRLQGDAGVSRVYSYTTDADGKFDIEAHYSTEVKKGAPVGKYKVLIGKWEIDESAADTADPDAEVEALEQLGDEEAAPPKSLINEKFNNPSATPLTLEVKAGENNFTIELKSDGSGVVK